MLIGRDGEVAAIEEVLDSALAGRGRTIVLTGEPGIGKSAMLRAASDRAIDRGYVVLAGGGWEVGGAPAYWPWLQILRAAADRFGVEVHALPGASIIAALVPGWGAVEATASIDPGAARFALLDAVVRAVIALAARAPVLVVLDDLHAADLATLDLLVLFVRELPRARIACLVASRDAELAARPDHGKRIGLASRNATVLPLRRLTRDEVRTIVAERADGDAVFAASEGNPLFVEEIVRAGRATAGGIAEALDDHLALVTPETREVLAIAAILGREADRAVLGSLAGSGLERAMREAIAARIVVVSVRGWSFCHVLLRDRLYDGLEPARRAELHGAAGRAFELHDPTGKHTALHLLAGPDRDAAIDVAVRAAARARDSLAFEDAVELLERAHELVPPIDARGISLLVDLAEARHRTGNVAAAHADSVRAAAAARTLGDAELLARAALVYAAELSSGRRDPVMVALLEDALAALPVADGIVRARVLVRLAAAVVPSPDDRPIRCAAEAVAMARRIGDDETTLFALRYQVHACGYQVPLATSMAMVEEVVALADRLGRSFEVIEQRMWLVGGRLSCGDVAGAEIAQAEAETLLARLPHPHYRWRSPMIHAVRATLRGEFEDAERSLGLAAQIAEDHDLSRAKVCVAFGRIGLAEARNTVEAGVALIDEAKFLVATIGPHSHVHVGYAMALAGRADEARGLVGAGLIPAPVISQFVAETAILIGDRALGAAALVEMRRIAAWYPMTYGPSMSMLLCPVDIIVGELCLLLDRPAEAIEPLERGLRLARSIDAIPYIARARAALARTQPSVGRASVPATGNALAMTRDGSSIHVHWRSRTLAIPSAKGFEYLVAILAAPGEIHVSDLVGDDDRGDAGEILDAPARAAYRERVIDLSRDLDEARDRNDIGRAELLAAELDAITDQLAAGVGLGGRARRAGSHVERARVNVQRRIRDAIKRLAAEDADLGRYLEATIRTGTYCSFTPLP